MQKKRHSLPHLPVSSYTDLVNISAPGAKSCSGDAIRNQTLKNERERKREREREEDFINLAMSGQDSHTNHSSSSLPAQSSSLFSK